MNRETLVEHLKIQHGYRDEETAPDLETAAGPDGWGIVNLSHPGWTDTELNDLHENDHLHDYPETGTPVRDWAHRHRQPPK